MNRSEYTVIPIFWELGLVRMLELSICVMDTELVVQKVDNESSMEGIWRQRGSIFIGDGSHGLQRAERRNSWSTERKETGGELG